MTRLSRVPFAWLVVVVAVALLAGCGGSSGDPNKLLDQTFAGSKDVRSGRLAVAVDLSVRNDPALSAPAALRLTGPFATQGPRKLPQFDVLVSLSMGGQSLAAGFVSTGDRGFVRYQGAAYAVPDPLFARFRSGYEQAQRASSPDQPSSLSALGINPRDWLRNPRVAGEQSVGGTQTKHMTADVDVGALLDDLNRALSRAAQLDALPARGVPGSLTADRRRELQQAVKRAHVDIFTGKDDKVLRRMAVDVSFAEAARQGGASGTLTFSLELDDLNRAQTIAPPPAARPLLELPGALALLGGLGAPIGAGAGAGASGA